MLFKKNVILIDYHFDELWEFEIEPYGELVSAVIDGPDESVVITE